MMIPKGETPEAMKERGAVKAKYARFFWPILRGIALIMALCAFVPFLAGFLYEGSWGTGVALGAFGLASFALIVMNLKPETLPATEGEATKKATERRLPDWSLIAYSVVVGLGFNWVCVFLWFSRRYAFFSTPVVGVTCLILALYAAIGLLAARLTGGNWRIALLVFALVPLVVGSTVLRLGLVQ
jgi:hypothetical protein